MPTPPDMPFAQLRSSGTFTASAQHTGQHVPISSVLLYANGGLQSIGLHEMPPQVSTADVGEYTGYLPDAASTETVATKRPKTTTAAKTDFIMSGMPS